jgi:8-amino-7-oxononanoate synthase
LREAIVAALNETGMVGAGGSRLLRGHHPAHERLEQFAAEFFGVERALYLATGYAANQGCSARSAAATTQSCSMNTSMQA